MPAAFAGRSNLEDADLAIGASQPVSPTLELDVDFASLEQEARDLAALVDDVVGHLADNGGGQLHRASGMGTATRAYPSRVVGDINDTLERHAEPFRDKLGKARFVALSRGHRAHHQLDLAFGKHGDLGALARCTAGDLDIIGDANTAQLAAFPSFGASGGESIPIGERQCRVQRILVAGRVLCMISNR